MEQMLEIPVSVIERVVEALNLAVGVTQFHAKECHASILQAAIDLGEAIHDATATEP